VCADPAERVVQLQRIEIAAAFVEHVARDRGKPGTVRRIGRRSHGKQRKEADERHAVVLDGPHAQAVGERTALNVREAKRGIGTEGRQPSAIDGHQETATDLESASARLVRPFGTTLRLTQRSRISHSRATRCIAAGVTLR
jgi:hypothetical protein